VRRTLFRARVLLPPAAALAVALWLWHPWRRPITIVERINPTDGAAMVWVPAGSFRMGGGTGEGLLDALLNRLSGYATSNKQPAHSVYLDGYWIYKYEVTVKQYHAFCRATKRAMPPAPEWGWQDNHPIVNVTWHDASTYAAWAGASLPTEAQWEKAARGPDGRVYPWGNAWDGAKCCNSVDPYDAESPSPVGSFPAGASPYGAQDMTGNVWERCAVWYDALYNDHAPPRNPTGATTGQSDVVRGGSWGRGDPWVFRAAYRNGCDPSYRVEDLGFRCVLRSLGP